MPAVRTSGVVERLEHRLHVVREVLEVHVVDRVGERLAEAEGLRRLEARPVLDVARPRRGGTSSSTGSRGGRAPVPVAIEAAHTGVTDGKAATQSSTCWPRSISSSSAGARPAATARSSIAGFIASMTARTSFLRSTRPVLTAGCAGRRTSRPRGGARRRAATTSPAMTSERERREEDRRAGGDERDALAVERQRVGGLRVEAAAHAGEQRPRRHEAEQRDRRRRRARPTTHG